MLRAGAVALGGAGAGWSGAVAAGALASAPADDVPADDVPSGAPAEVAPPLGGRIVPFHGAHQAGVATPPQAFLSLLGIDLLDPGPDALRRLLTLLSDDAARLSRGLPALADTEPELAAHPAGLTVTFGLGPRVMNGVLGGRAGVLEELPAFATDRLDPAWEQTDLAVQICADDPMTVAHARRLVLRDCARIARPVWRQDGFRRAVGTEAAGTTMRNVMGQVDGTANPSEADPDFADLVWSQAPGFEGGTTMVVRRIRARMELWEAVDRRGREAAVGRRLDNGAPLTGRREHDEPDLGAVDDLGLPVIDPASHVARARSADRSERFLRRGYNYVVPDAGQPTGEDSGLVFVVFAADVGRQFVPVQRRLAELDRLNRWITTIGSAVYAVPPGAAEGEHVGRTLLDRG